MTIRRISDDRGAVAITVAILAIVLFGIGAVAVDLGNMAYKRSQAQSAADFAALAGGAQLPNTTAAASAAVANLQANSLGEWGDTSLWTVGQFTNGNPADGEITFSPNKTQMTVRTPTAQVSFGLAAALDRSSGPVAASATSAIRSPGSVLPFFLPVTCADPGRYVIKTETNGGGGGTPTLPTPPAVPTGGGQRAQITAIAPQSIQPNTTPVLTVTGSRFDPTTPNPPGPSAFRIWNSTGTTIVQQGVSATATATQLTFSLTTATTGTQGVYWVQVERKTPPNNRGWSDPVGIVVGTDPLLGCGDPSSGNFGYIGSWRFTENNPQQATIPNIAFGLDHAVELYPLGQPPTSNPVAPSASAGDNDCQQQGQSLWPSAVLDRPFAENSGAPTPNCLTTDTGFDGQDVFDGIASGRPNKGVPTDEARLKRAPDSYPAGADPTLCNRTYSYGGVSGLNNDRLACYLTNGGSIGALLSNGNPGVILDPTIVQSPRFFFIPILNTLDRGNGSKDFPIVEFVPAFLDSDDAGNGLSGPTNRISLAVATFSISALPEFIGDEGGTGIPYLGTGPKLVRLVG